MDEGVAEVLHRGAHEIPGALRQHSVRQEVEVVIASSDCRGCCLLDTYMSFAHADADLNFGTPKPEARTGSQSKGNTSWRACREVGKCILRSSLAALSMAPK